ncbi:MAG: adenylate/guanylate cyclase domain-containing protein [Alphaproteobacteria bacterium]
MSQTPLTSAVLFADICDSTRLYDMHGDGTAYELVAAVLARVARAIERHDGTVVKAIGDGVIAIFPEPDKALLSATGIVAPEEEDGVSLRAGLHFGPLIMVDGDVFGDVVNVASRVVALAQSGEVLMTGELRGQLNPILRGGVGFLDAISVKGKPEPIEIYRIVAGAVDATVVGAPTAIRLQATTSLELAGAGQVRRLTGAHQRLVIGRQSDCDLIVLGPRISRQHARIEQAHGHFFIHDSSANGTFVQQTGGSIVALRRGGAPLGRAGRIALGQMPADGSDFTLSYRVVD